ncbi:hypothetical protein ACHHYP_17001 [Achlya hypogyna]|uniref:Ribosome biogenesis protein SLX9 n=1 Tax=Achlya hypogyna TaxID=1202772 RepID=A0A1V9ZDM6_ACHHY|nr:hypothetical protein ACHHYP_17001 [Achlya hypogyna]
MGKVRRNKSYRVHQPAAQAKKPDADAEGSDAGEPETPEAHLSRGQRKRQKRRDAFLKKMGMVQRTVAEKEKAAKKTTDGMFGDLEELQKSLFSAEVAPVEAEVAPKTVSKMTGKQKKRMAMQELGHLKAVQTHPAFQSNPFAAIQMHLQNTVVRENEAKK